MRIAQEHGKNMIVFYSLNYVEEGLYYIQNCVGKFWILKEGTNQKRATLNRSQKHSNDVMTVDNNDDNHCWWQFSQCKWKLYQWVLESMNNSPLRRNKFEGDITYTPTPTKIGDKKNKISLIIVNSCQTFQISKKFLTNVRMKDY